MRFTSLIVELIRARPRLVVWLVVLAQGAVWFVLPVLLYTSPPADLATTLAFGREYRIGSDLGPPLAFWLADIAYRLVGNHLFGVYLLSQMCFGVTLWAIFALGRAIVGAQQAVLAVLLTATIATFNFPSLAFSPAVLACPFWALCLLYAYQIMGEGKRSAWFALSIAAGLLLLTTTAAAGLLALLAVFALATPRGRQALRSFDPLFALLVIAVLALPYLVWAVRTNAIRLPAVPSFSALGTMATAWGMMLGALAVALIGVAALAVANTRYFRQRRANPPIIFRRPIESFARGFVFVFAFVPALLMSMVSVVYGSDTVAAGAGTVLVLSGLAVIVASDDLLLLRREYTLRILWSFAVGLPVAAVLLLPMLKPLFRSELETLQPASAIGEFFSENYQRRTGAPLRSVAGDPGLATLIGLSAARPQVYLASGPRTPWLTPERIAQTGGVVVWRAADTAGTPPREFAQLFPGLVPEVPRLFDRVVNGRLPPLRIGWAIIRPATR